MAQTAFKGDPVQLHGELPEVGSTMEDFALVRGDLSEASLADYADKYKVLNIFPSIDTGICAKSVRTFHERLNSRDDLVVLNISADLPFAASRFCGAEGIENAETLSSFRSSFGQDSGVAMTDGPFRGLLARAVIVLDPDNKVTHVELVPEIAQEPNYDDAIAALP